MESFSMKEAVMLLKLSELELYRKGAIESARIALQRFNEGKDTYEEGVRESFQEFLARRCRGRSPPLESA